ncbi:MAG: hypothetical protein AAGA48_10270 [Myxococcota bacterium]
MGIEPLLLIGIVLAMFLVQVVRAAHNALTDRVEYALLTMDGAGEHAKRRAMAPEAIPVRALVPVNPVDAGRPAFLIPDNDARAWTQDRPGGLLVRMVASRWPGPARRAMRLATGVHQRRIRHHHKWLAPSILVLVTLPRNLVPGLLISPRPLVVKPHEQLDLHSPVLDHVLRVATDQPDRTRRLLLDAQVHEPLIEMMAMHPLSVVTGQVVALWCTQAVNDPEPLVQLAEEVARALLQATEHDDDQLGR